MSSNVFFKRPQSSGEEIANSITHGIAAALALAAIPILIINAAQTKGALGIVSVSVFGGSLFLLYLTSTLYHGFPAGRIKQSLKLFDHCAIYLLIAGTYTPVVLVGLGGAWGWSLFGTVWGLALVGIVIETLLGVKNKIVINGLHLMMGWTVIVAAKPMLETISAVGLWWLLAGGLAYTLGILFYAFDSRLRYSHSVWHLFVVAGSVCHFVMVWRYLG